jgi:hypothetical protein
MSALPPKAVIRSWSVQWLLLTQSGRAPYLLRSVFRAMFNSMEEAFTFWLQPFPLPWVGGEPRVFAINKEDNFPQGWHSIKDARLVDVQYETGGITSLLDSMAGSCDVPTGSFQAVLENLEVVSQKAPLVIVVRDADRLLSDVGPAVIHLITGWEGFTHHASGISAMYLVLETGPRAIIDLAFYPGGAVDWGHR